jgi:hypothetical protein
MPTRSCLVVAVALASCSRGPPSYAIEVVSSTTVSDPTGGRLTSISLTVDPDDGAIRSVHANGVEIAIYEIRSENPFLPRLVWRGYAALSPAPNDAAALGGGRYALVSREGGFLLDVRGTVEPHFCFVPGRDTGDWPLELDQWSFAVAHDPVRGVIWAQPFTFRGRDLVRSEIGAFDEATGENVGWWPLDLGFQASAMAVLSDGRLVLADDVSLLAWDASTNVMAEVASLSELGIRAVDSLASREETGTVVAFDAAAGRMIELRLTPR